MTNINQQLNEMTPSQLADLIDEAARILWERNIEAAEEGANETLPAIFPGGVPCPVCKGKRYLICERDEGREAVEACDMCRDEKTFSDEQAALLAQADGVRCESVYPCYLMS